MIYSCRHCISSDLNSIKILIEKIIGDLQSYIKLEEVLFDIRLILNELVVNSAIHGNKLNNDLSISVSVEIDEESVSIFVKDEGRGITKEIPKYNPKNLTTDGRGLFLIECLSDKFEINNNEFCVVKLISE